MKTDRIYSNLTGKTYLYIENNKGIVVLDSRYPTYLLAQNMVKPLLTMETNLIYIKSGLALYSFKHEYVKGGYAIIRTIKYLCKGQKKQQLGATLVSW